MCFYIRQWASSDLRRSVDSLAAITLWKLEEDAGADNGRAMTTPGTGDQDTKVSAAAKNSFPQYPGGNFLAHAGTQWLELAEAHEHSSAPQPAPQNPVVF